MSTEQERDAEATELDEKVLSKLKTTPMAAVDLVRKVGLSWPDDGGVLRASLLRLQKAGKADVEYGFGWYKTVKARRHG